MVEPANLGSLRFRDAGALAGMALIVIIVLAALLSPILAPESPYQNNLERSLQGPSRGNLFGTDELGRDILSRVMHGGRVTLAMGVVAVAIGSLIGGAIGMAAGTIRGPVDAVLSHLMDLMLAFPAVLLALVIMAGLGPSLVNAMLAVGIVYVPKFARVTRTVVLSESTKDYVLAARATGCGILRIYWSHLFPNCLSPLLVMATLSLGTAILETAALSFLGLGAQPPIAEWGAMLSEGRRFLHTAPHVALFPGLAIFVSVLGVGLLGDSLRDRLDPRYRPR